MDSVMIQALQALLGVGGINVVKHLVSALIKPFVSDTRFYPLSSILLGVAWNVGLGYVLGIQVAPAVIMGVLTGLAASGDFDITSALIPKAPVTVNITGTPPPEPVKAPDALAQNPTLVAVVPPPTS